MSLPLSESSAHQNNRLDRLKPVRIQVLGKGDCHLCLLFGKAKSSQTIQDKISCASSVPSLGLRLLYFGWQAWQTKLHLAVVRSSLSRLLRSISQSWDHCKFLPAVTISLIECQFCLLLFHTYLQRKCEPHKHSARVIKWPRFTALPANTCSFSTRIQEATCGAFTFT